MRSVKWFTFVPFPSAKHFQLGLSEICNGKASAPTSLQQVISVDEEHGQNWARTVLRAGVRKGSGKVRPKASTGYRERTTVKRVALANNRMEDNGEHRNAMSS